MQYDLESLAVSKTPRQIELRPIDNRLGTELEYERLLKRMIADIYAEYQRSVLLNYTTYLSYTADAPQWFELLRQTASSVVQSVSVASMVILNRESVWHTGKFKAAVKAATKIDPPITDFDVQDLVRDRAAQNASLIKSLSDDAVRKIERIVIDAKTQALSADEVDNLIKQGLGKEQRRAAMIVRDQLATLNSQLNRYRQEEAGVKFFRWRTMRDSVVRPAHLSVGGKVFRWKQAKGLPDGNYPGEAINCRCLAIPVLRTGNWLVGYEYIDQ